MLFSKLCWMFFCTVSRENEMEARLELMLGGLFCRIQIGCNREEHLHCGVPFQQWKQWQLQAHRWKELRYILNSWCSHIIIYEPRRIHFCERAVAHSLRHWTYGWQNSCYSGGSRDAAQVTRFITIEKIYASNSLGWIVWANIATCMSHVDLWLDSCLWRRCKAWLIGKKWISVGVRSVVNGNERGERACDGMKRQSVWRLLQGMDGCRKKKSMYYESTAWGISASEYGSISVVDLSLRRRYKEEQQRTSSIIIINRLQ